jgi:predicted RNA-binding protein YlqC (UPF0109 family)
LAIGLECGVNIHIENVVLEVTIEKWSLGRKIKRWGKNVRTILRSCVVKVGSESGPSVGLSTSWVKTLVSATRESSGSVS